MPKTNKFIDDFIDHKEDDIEKLQTKLNMYISYGGSAGALHLSKELINNAIDECINKNSMANKIDIIFDELENTLTVKDNGRGIEFDRLEIACTKLQSSSKFFREGIGAPAGENGVGLTAVNALSSIFEIISSRYGESAKLIFHEGKKINDIIIKKIKEDKHGLTVVFKPSKLFLGECKINIDDLINWIEKISYLLPENVIINLQAYRTGNEAPTQKKYRNKTGLIGYIKNLNNNFIIDPILIEKHTDNLSEINQNKEYKRFMKIETSVGYDPSISEIIVHSFCNFVNTIEGGYHVEGVKKGLVSYFTRKAKNSLSDREKKNNLVISSVDILRGLILVINLSTNMNPQFSGQTKEKLTNGDFFNPISVITQEALAIYFREHTKELEKIIKYIKTNAKLRHEATEKRNSVLKNNSDTYFDDHRIAKFYPCNNTAKNSYKELFIVEGDSASGSCKNGRDPNTQAIFLLKGKPINVLNNKFDLSQLEELRNLVKILGTNIGHQFDINRLKYNKIIIMTDSDVDGYHISSLLCTFFISKLPELVKNGYIYKAISPLYSISDKENPFILNKREYIKLFEKNVSKKMKIANIETKNFYSKDELTDFLEKNRYYLDDIHKISKHFAIDPFIIEHVVYYLNDKHFKDKITKKFPEIYIDDENIMTGVFDGRYQTLRIDSSFEKYSKTIKKYIFNKNDGNLYYYIVEKINKKEEIDRGKMSLYQFMSLINKFAPKIEVRYKGLGELNAQELWQTTMDPNSRILIQLTSENIEQELITFNILHNDNKKDLDIRKQFMKEFEIDPEDLEN